MDRKVRSPQSDSDIIINLATVKNTRFSKIGGLILGRDSTESNNIKFHRAGNRLLQFVPGDDITPEGTKSINPLKVKVIGMGGVPIGTIVSWVGGYYTAPANVGFTSVLGNTISDVNTHLLIDDDSWKVCDGSTLLDTDSPIFNVAGRYLPDLTDSRFLAGATVAGQTSITDIGATGGTPGSSVSNHVITQPTFTSPSHYHAFNLTAAGQSYSGSNSTDSAGNHGHSSTHSHHCVFDIHTDIKIGAGFGSESPSLVMHYSGTLGSPIGRDGTLIALDASANIGGSGDHSHNVSITHTHSSSSVGGTVGNTGGSNGDSTMTCSRTTDVALSNSENRPKYLSCFYIIKFK